MSGQLFRGIKEPPIDEMDFLSHVEHPDLPGDPAQCKHWGLSVWVSKDDAEHARGVHKYMKRWAIASGIVNESDGVFLPTPSIPNHPEHCTFWKVINAELASKFQIVLPPMPRTRS